MSRNAVGQGGDTQDVQQVQGAPTASYWEGMQWDKAVTLKMYSKYRELQQQVTGKECSGTR